MAPSQDGVINREKVYCNPYSSIYMKIAKAVSLFVLHLFEGSSGISEMKDTVKALKKMALLDAKHRNRVKCG